MSRKHVSRMFFKGNVEIEARENAPISQFRFSSESDYDKFMAMMKPKEPYNHTNCGHKGYWIRLHVVGIAIQFYYYFRLWILLGYRWQLEISISNMYVSCCDYCTWISWSKLSRCMHQSTCWKQSILCSSYESCKRKRLPHQCKGFSEISSIARLRKQVQNHTWM